MKKLQDELQSLYVQKQIIQNKIKTIEIQIQNNSDFEVILKDKIYLNTVRLSYGIINELKEIASFDNPQINILQNLRRPIYNTPKLITSYEEEDDILILPRGLMRDVILILNSYNIQYKLLDKRINIKEKFKSIKYVLRGEQTDCCKSINKKDFSICVAPPGFGKTLIGAKMISIRNVNTLIIVNKNMLLDQWISRFIDYFKYDKKDIGFLGKGKNKLNSKLDVATMQSLKNNPNIIKDYSFVIVDECHHIPALTFESIIQKFEGKYILGLSATPNRKDAMDPILFQQLGNIAYEVSRKNTGNHKLKIVKTNFTSEVNNFSNLLSDLINDNTRNNLIIEQILKHNNRKILLLTDRIEHIENLCLLLDIQKIEYLSIHGSMNKKTKEENIIKIKSSTLILATSSYFGEGIDFPHLNTIIFATPISYYGRLVQYLGRIGRGGSDCLAIDIYDDKNNFTKSSFKKRQAGYKQLHYTIIQTNNFF
jgi:superfamily II DNA or RNA helicase